MRNSGRNLVLAYVGLWGVLGDSVVAIYRQSVALLASAEARGAQLERAVGQRIQRAIDPRAGEPRAVSPREIIVIGHRRSVLPEVASVEEALALEQQVKAALSKLGIPSRARLERLSEEIESLTARIDEELRRADMPASSKSVTTR